MILKRSERLTESTEPANLTKLQVQMASDSTLNMLLQTPAKDLPAQYRFLVEEIYEESKPA